MRRVGGVAVALLSFIHGHKPSPYAHVRASRAVGIPMRLDRGRVAMSSLPLFPDGGGGAPRPRQPAQKLSQEELVGVWSVYDRLALIEQTERATATVPASHGLATSPPPPSLILNGDGDVIRSTTSTFATGTWHLEQPEGPEGPIEVVMLIRSKTAKEALEYRGVVLVTDRQGSLGGSIDLDSAGCTAVAEQLGVYGSVRHVSSPDPLTGEVGDGIDANGSPRDSLAGRFSLLKRMGLGSGGDDEEPGEFVCEVGQPQHLL
mmetsp:Transcript_20803/g.53683  ORF Transcript_20803/g.53683 Transcript_20803/m.53683 type:complete len:261 (+) Transcript_20803:14-796(+)